MPELELFTRRLTRDELDSFIHASKALKSFRPRRKGDGAFGVCGRDLPTLSAYEFDVWSDIVCTHEFESYSDELASLYFDLLAICESIVLRSWIKTDIAESGCRYDSREQSDLRVYCGYDDYGPTVRLSVGAASPGALDLSYRRAVFMDFIKLAGLQEHVTCFVNDNKLWVKPTTDRTRLVLPLDNLEPASYTPCQGFLIRLDAAGTDGGNTYGLKFNGFSADGVRSIWQDTVEHWGRDRVVDPAIDFVVNASRYHRLREKINASSFSPWHLRFGARSKYNIDTLDGAVAENEDFLLNAFSMKPLKVGEVEVEILYDQTGFMLCFTGPWKDAKQRAALEELTIGLAGGKDIIDHTTL